MHDMMACRLSTPVSVVSSQLATPAVGSCGIGRTIRPNSYNDGDPAVVTVQSEGRREPIRAAGVGRKSKLLKNCYITVCY